MSTSEHDLFQKYMDFADVVESRLVAKLGARKAKKLFCRMDRAQFDVLCEAARTDSLKRDWLYTLEHGYANLLNGRKEAA